MILLGALLILLSVALFVVAFANTHPGRGTGPWWAAALGAAVPFVLFGGFVLLMWGVVG